MKNYPRTIDEILANCENIETIESLRRLVKNTIPNVTETIRRGNITFVLNGKDLLRILIFKSHIDLGFVNGTKLASLLLKRRGRGKDWRHLEVKSPKDVDNPEVERLLKRSAELFLLEQ